jgi:hypothetical protein
MAVCYVRYIWNLPEYVDGYVDGVSALQMGMLHRSVRYRWARSIKVSAVQMGMHYQGRSHLMMTDDDQTMYCSIQVGPVNFVRRIHIHDLHIVQLLRWQTTDD